MIKIMVSVASIDFENFIYGIYHYSLTSPLYLFSRLVNININLNFIVLIKEKMALTLEITNIGGKYMQNYHKL